MLIIGILLFGMLVGAAAQRLLGTRGHGIIGSIAGGIVVTLAWNCWHGRRQKVT